MESFKKESYIRGYHVYNEHPHVSLSNSISPQAITKSEFESAENQSFV